MSNRCLVCDWWTEGTARDPRPQPPHMACFGAGSIDQRCAANWLNFDPEDRAERWPSYEDWLLEVRNEVQPSS